MGKMNKAVYVLFAALILAAVSVSAIENLNGLYKYRCEIVRPATEFRPEKSFGYIGILGRLSDGSLTCFLPSRPRTKTAPATVVVVPTQDNNGVDPVCTQKEVCEDKTSQVCHNEPCCREECHKEKSWKQTCEWKRGKLHCNYGWVWTDVCSQVCVDHEVCESVTEKVCHNEEVCV
jgi:hypothetical protein